MRLALFLILLPVAAHCAALSPEAMAAFQQPGVSPALYAKISHGAPLTLADVVTLSNANVSGGSIIEYLYSFGQHFRLTPEQVSELRVEQVRPDLIAYMTSLSAHPAFYAF